jgi:cell division septation protein DedD
MADQSFREIQLGGKQLVFLFMCAVVLTVVVFLLGVSVGRDMRAAPSPTIQASVPTRDAPTTAAPPAGTPAGSDTAAADLSYPQALKGDPSAAPPPAPISELPPVETPRSDSHPRAAEPPTPKSERPSYPVPAAVPSPATTASGWIVQVGAFNRTEVASGEAAKLQAKGYPAFVFTEPASTPGPRYKVRVGPYPGRSDADRMLKTLASEGYKPLLKR